MSSWRNILSLRHPLDPSTQKGLATFRRRHLNFCLNEEAKRPELQRPDEEPKRPAWFDDYIATEQQALDKAIAAKDFMAIRPGLFLYDSPDHGDLAVVRSISDGSMWLWDQCDPHTLVPGFLPLNTESWHKCFHYGGNACKPCGDVSILGEIIQPHEHRATHVITRNGVVQTLLFGGTPIADYLLFSEFLPVISTVDPHFLFRPYMRACFDGNEAHGISMLAGACAATPQPSLRSSDRPRPRR